ncbi:hypothetical protein B0A55_05635 [Friedmanniomyces simplex]|uniref:Uncharacterized protein n=1 Tax=Friedmanniomyces simplex TaxID=329884 RepID=A0A4U0X4A9_9PEZI|nr:hypothetical protein B0A55_05635 [Friedmanniomyces simplex]
MNMIIGEPDAGTKRIAQLKHLDALLGHPSTRPKGYSTFSKETTANAMRSIKALFSEAGRSPDVQLTDERYQTLFAKIKWKFGDIFDAIDFLSAYGRDDIFNQQRLSVISLSQPDVPQGSGCCQLLSRESESRCECREDSCLICAFEDPQLQDVEEFLAAPRDTTPPSNPTTTASSLWSPDVSVADLDRAPCPHTQTHRLFSFLAAHLTRRGYDSSLPRSVEQLRQDIMTAWRKVQATAGGWKWSATDEFPPNERNVPVTVECDGGVMLRYHIYATAHGEGVPRVLTFCFVGEWELLV